MGVAGAPSQKGDAHGGEIRWTNDVVRNDSVAALQRFRRVDIVVPSSLVKGEKGKAGSVNTWQSADSPFDFLIQRKQARIFFVTSGGFIDLEQKNVFLLEAHVHAREIHESSKEQARPGQQGQ